ncbi:MAG: hypothetical protein ACKVWV_00730 [Planctomycetota bacterium]
MKNTRPFVLCAAALLGACASTPTVASNASKDATPPDPRSVEVALPALAGWNGTLVLDQGKVGIWTVLVTKVFPQYGCPEIVGIDDLGRCHVIWSYSGKWTPVTTISDGKWLGGLALADVDARIAGRELYTGSQQGNLYQVVAYENTLLDNRLIARIPGFEIHTVVAADVDAAHAGAEVLVFTSPGRLYVATPRESGKDGFELALAAELPGRVRDALVLREAPAEIATVGRHGRVEILRWKAGRPEFETVFETSMGMGRLARKPGDGPLVLYSTADDGVIRRHERGENGEWTHELVYGGPQGPRGIAAGRFDADPSVETIALVGYSKRVELLTRREAGWVAETIFEDREKGHWVCAGELDGRNGTDELVVTGYSGRIVLLARPPGVGWTETNAAVLKPTAP